MPVNSYEQMRRLAQRAVVVCFMVATATVVRGSVAHSNDQTLSNVIRQNDITVLADVKHGVRERIAFLSSEAMFKTLAAAGVRHIAIEMPRVLGRQARGIETQSDVDVFAQDVLRSGRWHFVDPDHPMQISNETQYAVAYGLGMQVFLARRLGMNVIVYDFNNPLGGFRRHNDPVYRCITQLSHMTWLKYGLDEKVTKAQRDAAIMRERLSHDDELADYIVREMAKAGSGKVVLIPGYAHAVLPGGLRDALEQRLNTKAAVVAVFRDADEDTTFHNFLWEQSRLLGIDLSQPPDYRLFIDTGQLEQETAPGRYSALNASSEIDMPQVCFQLAQTR